MQGCTKWSDCWTSCQHAGELKIQHGVFFLSKILQPICLPSMRMATQVVMVPEQRVKKELLLPATQVILINHSAKK